MISQSPDNFRKREDGTVLVFVAMCLAVIVGMAAITFDLGRLAATQGDLQSYVDNVALAAAGELDGAPDSITRASSAAAAMIIDNQTFADGGQALGSVADYSLRFLNGLPASDTADVSTFVTNTPEEASLIEVTATPRVVFLPFARALASMIGATLPNEQVGARAIAGYTQYACDVTPLMFCLPPADEFGNPYTADGNKGDGILLRTGKNGGAWGPGNFGFLDMASSISLTTGPCAGLSGVKLTSCAIAAAGNVSACFAQRGVDMEPGQKVGIANAIFNTRFDMYNATMTKAKNDPAYAPGPHVVKGFKSKNGNGSCIGQATVPTTDTMPFPEDNCHLGGSSCTLGRIGNGTWNVTDYLDTNHGPLKDSNGNVITDGVGDPVYFSAEAEQRHADLQAFVAAGNTTRYDVYKKEIELAAGGDILLGRDETGYAQCSSPSDVIADPERRVFIAAGIECNKHAINGAKKGVPVKEFFKVFLTRPVGAGTQNPPFDLYVEVVGSAGGDGAGSSNLGGIFHDVVVLYR